MYRMTLIFGIIMTIVLVLSLYFYFKERQAI
jgi:hypothetical protein